MTQLVHVAIQGSPQSLPAEVAQRPEPVLRLLLCVVAFAPSLPLVLGFQHDAIDKAGDLRRVDRRVHLPRQLLDRGAHLRGRRDKIAERRLFGGAFFAMHGNVDLSRQPPLIGNNVLVVGD